MEPEALFSGLELEEPSPSTDAGILAAARGHPCRPRRAVRRLVAGALLSSAFAAALLAFLLIRPGGLLAPDGASRANVAEAAPLAAIAEMREDLDQIKEMAELIPPERLEEQEDLEARIGACLRDLERLEMELRGLTESSLHEWTRKKEIKI